MVAEAHPAASPCCSSQRPERFVVSELVALVFVGARRLTRRLCQRHRQLHLTDAVDHRQPGIVGEAQRRHMAVVAPPNVQVRSEIVDVDDGTPPPLVDHQHPTVGQHDSGGTPEHLAGHDAADPLRPLEQRAAHRERYSRPLDLIRVEACDCLVEVVRVWNDRRYEVIVLADGYEFEGRTFRSLSAVAREITGTRWNGKVFFGLKKVYGRKAEGGSDA